MNDTALPIQSNKTLLKASIWAAIIAIAILVLIILPTEYDIDPTGFGKMSGLSQLYSSESSTEQQQSSDSDTSTSNTATSKPSASNTSKELQNSVKIEVLAGEGLEYKFFLEEHQKLEYTWQTDGAPLYFDFHGEPQGDTTGFFESFTIATTNKMQGTLTTPFAGSHGWYWRNDNDKKVTITLKTKGHYKLIGLK